MDRAGLRERIERVRERIERAATRGARRPAEVELMAVTKGHPAEILLDIAACGIDLIGENRVGEAEAKRTAVGRTGLRWHMVGHLQRNKAARAVALFDAIESVDSIRLARRLARELEKRQEPAESSGRLEVAVQVNASGEESKGGFSVERALDGVAEVCALPRLRVTGLMTMAPLGAAPAALHEVFGRTRELFERCAAEVSGFEPHVLSMGMSDDFEIAVEEGSTRVRLGTALLGPRPET